ncbi:hypothetical protein [Streptomyces sp. EN16]|uniref:hypothetical protein n=1 Tax=Streptomyces sp. EN16 TaxID=212773 RepID=UPI00159F2CDB|nr:hypothetical protein [Streptomyces sp. EN16]
MLVAHAPGADRLFGTGVQPGDLQEVLDEAAQVADPGPQQVLGLAGLTSNTPADAPGPLDRTT